jgi:hypothetical protein
MNAHEWFANLTIRERNAQRDHHLPENELARQIAAASTGERPLAGLRRLVLTIASLNWRQPPPAPGSALLPMEPSPETSDV